MGQEWFRYYIVVFDSASYDDKISFSKLQHQLMPTKSSFSLSKNSRFRNFCRCHEKERVPFTKNMWKKKLIPSPIVLQRFNSARIADLYTVNPIIFTCNNFTSLIFTSTILHFEISHNPLFYLDHLRPTFLS